MSGAGGTVERAPRRRMGARGRAFAIKAASLVAALAWLVAMSILLPHVS